MSKENNLHDYLTDLADSIREVEGSTDPINPQDFSDRVKAIGTNSGAFGATATLAALIEGNAVELTSNATKVKDSAFKSNSEITSLNLPSATSIGTSAFQGCTALTSVNLPSVHTIKKTAFCECTALKTANIPNCGNINGYAFQLCSSLASVNMPGAVFIAEYAFAGCKSLTKIIIGNGYQVANVEPTTFNGCYHLTGTVDETYNPDGLKDCYIYVPDAWVDDYRSATNWSTYADQIKGISELPTEE